MEKEAAGGRSSSSDLSGTDIDDEYTRWRQALTQQVEQELEEQVRLRIGRRIGRGRSCTRQPRLDTPSSCCGTRPEATLCGDLRSFSRLSTDENLRNGHMRKVSGWQESEVKCLSVSESNKMTKVGSVDKLVCVSIPALGHPGTNLREHGADKRCKIPMLWHYINSKYGTPVQHLQYLAATGNFKSTLHDSGSSGGGPLIRYPPEANISLTTPTHQERVSPIVFPLTSMMSPKSFQEGKSENNAENSPSGINHGIKSEAVCQLKFESRFEGGNLQQAIEIGDKKYQLTLRSDLYSGRHTQWFYFQVKGMEASTPYQFHIVNLRKPDSLYNHGMQPLFYSQREAETGWRRVGHHITYGPTPSSYAQNDEQFFTLSWTMEFPHSGDICYLAHCYPYPLSRLLVYVENLQLSSSTGIHVHCEQLCLTLAGNTCPVLTITDFQDQSTLESRGGIVVTARVHPSESNSSWVMEGLTDWLTSDAPHAKVLRTNFVFKLIPMLNPDGVVVGNSRTSLVGVDLNRVYKKPRQDLFPTIYHTKAMLTSLKQERGVMLYVDLHGHSRKQNVFTYGCHTRHCDHKQLLNERVFPFLLSRQLPGVFCFKSCKFAVQRCKESTGRVVTWKMGISNAFTLESTFCGCTVGHWRWQFGEHDFKEIGRGLGEAIYCHHRMSVCKSYKQKILSELAEVLMSGHSYMTKEQPLPDLVQCSTQLSRYTEHPSCKSTLQKWKHRNKAAAKKMTKQAAAKTLREFMKYNLSLLDRESSTSGSDSENDEFEYQDRKKQYKRVYSRPGQSTVPSSIILPSLVKHKTKANYIQTAQSRVQDPVTKAILKKAQHGGHAPRLRDTTRAAVEGTGSQHLGLGWTFINRYVHRSNGGIPMFAEERLKERAKKDGGHHLLWQPLNSKVQEGNSRHFATQLLRPTSGGQQVKKSDIHQLSPCTAAHWNHGPDLNKPHGSNTDVWQHQVKHTEGKKELSLGAAFAKAQSKQLRLQIPSSLVKYISDSWKSSSTNS